MPANFFSLVLWPIKFLVVEFEESNTRVSRLLEQIHRPGSEALFRFIYEFGHSTQHVNTHLHTQHLYVYIIEVVLQYF